MPIFDAASLHKAVDDTLKASNTGADKNAFVVIVTKDAAGHVIVQGVVSTKVGEHWQIGVPFAIDHEKRITGGVEVKATW